MSNFFNAIGVASMEKVHSTIIGWIFEDKNEKLPDCDVDGHFSTFSLNIRSQVLCELFR